MDNNYYAVIMAGGIGSRLWPVSTSQFPKQFHDMLGTGQTLLQKTVERISSLIPLQNTYVLTNDRYLDLVLEQLPKISSTHVVLEPVMRNTAPCLLLSAFKIYKENPNALILVVPSDHWIEDETSFLNDVDICFKACQSKDMILTLGIEPTFPNTGYGYIESDKSDVDTIKKVIEFKEKPDYETAKIFLSEGNYLWNAGIFIWSVKSILKAFETHLPETFGLLLNGNQHYNTAQERTFIEANYKHSENVSIDYGIMEKALNVVVLPVNFDWNDLGTWSSLYDELDKDSDGNATVDGAVIYKESRNNIVKTQSGKHIVIQGLSDFIIVEKENVLLICPKNKEQGIKQLRSEAKTRFGDEIV